MDMVEPLLTVIKKTQEDMPGTCLNLEAEWAEERIAAVGILLRCMQENGKCRNTIVDKVELAPVLESFMNASDVDRFEIVQLFSELVKLNRRTFNGQILHIIKDEGAFSTMHTLLIYLQTALQDQCPVVAGLLLQLDHLAEPRKMSMYREEAIDTLISCLRNSNFPAVQITTAETIISLQGRFTFAGQPLARAFLLKRARLDKRYKTVMRIEELNNILEDSGEVLSGLLFIGGEDWSITAWDTSSEKVTYYINDAHSARVKGTNEDKQYMNGRRSYTHMTFWISFFVL